MFAPPTYGIEVPPSSASGPDGSQECQPNVLSVSNGRAKLNWPAAASGGGLFAITAEWCGYCTKLKNNARLARQRIPFDFYWMDGDKSPAHKAKAAELQVSGFPTLFYINRGGELSKYNGGREPSDLIQIFHK